MRRVLPGHSMRRATIMLAPMSCSKTTGKQLAEPIVETRSLRALSCKP
jgi:hypothetical protein